MLNIIMLFGVALITLVALYIGLGYKKYLERAHKELSEYLSFLRFARKRISLNGEPYSSACRSFPGVLLRENGFLTSLESGDTPAEAIKKTSTYSAFGTKGFLLLSDIMGSLGKGGLTEEISCIDRSISELSEHLDAEARENGKRVKSMLAVLMAVSLGACILII